MPELVINIAPEKEYLIKMLVEELGGEVEEKEQKQKAANPKAKKAPAKRPKKEKKVSPTFLFGKWKEFDIDPRKLREEAWGRQF